LKRIVGLAIAAVVTGVAMIAAADLTAARDRNRELVAAPAQKLNGSAAIAVVSIKDQRISIYDLITPSHPPFRHERQILLDSSMVLGGEDGTQQGSVPEGPEHV
jgi:predicted membrane protein